MLTTYNIGAITVWVDAEGRLHRDDDLPALVHRNGRMEWHQHGAIHRNGMPAVVSGTAENGHIRYYRNGVPHRDDGPAVVYTSHGRVIMQQWWHEGALLRSEMGGRTVWYKDGKPHRVDGPAVITHGVSEEWRQDGLLHRLGAPAFITVDGHQEWWVNGERQESPSS